MEGVIITTHMLWFAGVIASCQLIFMSLAAPQLQKRCCMDYCSCKRRSADAKTSPSGGASKDTLLRQCNPQQKGLDPLFFIFTTSTAAWIFFLHVKAFFCMYAAINSYTTTDLLTTDWLVDFVVVFYLYLCIALETGFLVIRGLHIFCIFFSLV